MQQNQQPNQRLTSEDWDQWAHNPVTEAFVGILARTVQETMEKWSYGNYTAETNDLSLRLDTMARAQVDILRQIIAQVEEAKQKPTEDTTGVFE